MNYLLYVANFLYHCAQERLDAPQKQINKKCISMGHVIFRYADVIQTSKDVYKVRHTILGNCAQLRTENSEKLMFKI